MNQLAAVVLTGGASRRMGRDKATLRWCGETLAGRVVRTVGSRCAPVIVVCAPHQDVGDVRAIVIEDLWPGQGRWWRWGRDCGLPQKGERVGPSSAQSTCLWLPRL